MRRILCSVGAFVWTAGVLVTYLLIIRSQGDSFTDGSAPYVAAAMAIAAILCAATAFTTGRAAPLAALVVLGVLALIGAMSIGILLVPPALAVIVALTSPIPVTPFDPATR